ncbi:hypothetical protein NDU88_006103 [Pleurodeles waltl]|uniref:Uncharacterized protein n=1 Tax=Pleurodeles waltl TaxID=8319 RepID=A0AAV7WX76_PLEWA|nr:hypothetical protein NDU88_006103 [Pleurodeles waltl]
MCAGGPSVTKNSISGAASWIRAALELRRSRRAISRVPLLGSKGRVSTGCAAAQTAETLETGKAVGGGRKHLGSGDHHWTVMGPTGKQRGTPKRGAEGIDLKKFVFSLIKRTMSLDETEVEIMKDIQRIHRDPFQRNPNNKKPQKISVNFQTYMLKEKILTKALAARSLEVEEFSFDIRSDLG